MKTSRARSSRAWRIAPTLAGLATLAACGSGRVEGRWSLAELELLPGSSLEVELARIAGPERLDVRVDESGAVLATHERGDVVTTHAAESFDAWKHRYPELVDLLGECVVTWRYESSWTLTTR